MIHPLPWVGFGRREQSSQLGGYEEYTYGAAWTSSSSQFGVNHDDSGDHSSGFSPRRRAHPLQENDLSNSSLIACLPFSSSRRVPVPVKWMWLMTGSSPFLRSTQSIGFQVYQAFRF